MSASAEARRIANLQIEAYNTCDLDAYCALLHTDAVLINLPEQEVIAEGMDQIRAMYTARFQAPGLHSEVLDRFEIGNIAIDREVIYTDGNPPVDILAMYEVVDSKIKRVFFIRGGEI